MSQHHISVLNNATEYKPPPTPQLATYKHKKFGIRHNEDGEDSGSSMSDCQSEPKVSSPIRRPSTPNTDLCVPTSMVQPNELPIMVKRENTSPKSPLRSSPTGGSPHFGSENSSFRRVTPVNPLRVAEFASAPAAALPHPPHHVFGPMQAYGFGLHPAYPIAPHSLQLQPALPRLPPQFRPGLPLPPPERAVPPFPQHLISGLLNQGTRLERVTGSDHPENVSNTVPASSYLARNSPSPSVSSRSSVDGASGSVNGGNPGGANGTHRRRKQEHIPDWVKVLIYNFDL